MKIIILVLLVICDFLTKKIIFNLVKLNEMISIIPFLDITHIHNYGISFGLFAGTIPPWLIIIIGFIMVIFLIFWGINSTNKFEKWGVILIIAGAISNIGDRIINNYVIDFIYFHYDNYYWPAFNLADIYISLGILVIIIESYKLFKNRLKNK